MKRVLIIFTLITILGTLSTVAQQDATIDKLLRTQSLLDQLELSEEQQAQFISIRDSYQEKLMTARKSGGDPAERMKKMKAIQYEQVEEVRDIMTEDQQAAFDELLENRNKVDTPARKSAGEVLE